jgi:hypothetical protein
MISLSMAHRIRGKRFLQSEVAPGRTKMLVAAIRTRPDPRLRITPLLLK